MSDILVTVDEQNLHITDAPKIAAQGVNENYLVFMFSPDWDGFGKVALFYRDGDEDNVYESAVDGDGRALIPHEVTDTDGKICFGVCGVKDDVVFTSEILKYKIVKGRYTAGQETEPPTPGIYEQMLNIAGDMQGLYTELRRDLNAEASTRAAVDTALSTSKADQTDLLALSSRMDNYLHNVIDIETELWTGAEKLPNTVINLSDDIANYDYIDIYVNFYGKNEFKTISASDVDPSVIRFVDVDNNNNDIIFAEMEFSKQTDTITLEDHRYWHWAGNLSTTPEVGIVTSESTIFGVVYKIVGRKLVENAEVQDIRVGSDGTVYQTAGTAVRSQISALNNKGLTVDSNGILSFS